MLSKTTFPEILEKFVVLEQNNNFEELCSLIEEFLKISNELSQGNTVSGGQFLLNRLCETIDKKSKEMIYRARDNRNCDVLTASIDCERDELKILNSNCQNILRNVLLTNNVNY